MNRNDRQITGFTMVGHAIVHTYELSIPILMTVWLVEFSVTSATLGTVVAVGYELFGIGAFGASFAGAALTYGSPTAVFLLLATFAGSALVLAVSLVVRDL